jgi:hypothetical protein
VSDGFEITPDAATTALNGIDAAGKTAADAWRGHRATIDAAEPGIGTGPLAEAFRSVYQPEPAEQQADRVLAAVPTVVRAGQEGVAEYIATDERRAASFAQGR